MVNAFEMIFNCCHYPYSLFDLGFYGRDLQRLGELQSELAGVADFSATYLRCQLLLIKVGLNPFCS